jgi:hypothetical protein
MVLIALFLKKTLNMVFLPSLQRLYFWLFCPTFEFQFQWTSIGLIHPINKQVIQQAIYWIQLVAQKNFNNITNLIIANEDWHHNYLSYSPLLSNITVIAHDPLETYFNKILAICLKLANSCSKAFALQLLFI